MPKFDLNAFLQLLLAAFTAHNQAQEAPSAPVGKVPVPTSQPVPAPAAPVVDDPGPMIVQLYRVSVQNPREGNVSALIDSGARALMRGDRVVADSNELREDGSNYGEEFKTPAEDILWQFFYGDSETPDLEVKGDEYRRGTDGNDKMGKHWLVSHQGLVKLQASEGFAIIGKLQEGVDGTSKGAIVCIHDGVVSDPIVFAKVD